MNDQIIIANLDDIIMHHVSWLFGDYGTVDREYIAGCVNQRLNKAMESLLSQCILCGGNWSAMLLSGIEYWMPEVYDAMPDRSYSLFDLVAIIKNQLLIALLPELFIDISFTELNWDMDDVSLFPEIYDWLFSDKNYQPCWFC